MIDNKLTVGQIAQKYGVTARTIRHYEAIGILDSTRDQESNYRLYGDAEVNRIDQIMLLKDMGFTLKEISTIITSDGNKQSIIRIIKNRLNNLTKKSSLFHQCIDLLAEFLYTCNSQEEDTIDSFQLLNELLMNKKEQGGAMLAATDSPILIHPLEGDKDLGILYTCRSEDLNPLFLPFVIEQEDMSLLENFFVNHRRFWGSQNVLLSDGSSLDEVYSETNFIRIIVTKLENTALASECFPNEGELSYQSIVAELCHAIAGIEIDDEDSTERMERKLAAAVFLKALEMYELAGMRNEAILATICRLIRAEELYTTKQQLEEYIASIIRTGGIQSFYIAKLADQAIKRNRYSGSFYVLTEPQAFESDCWEFDRAMDMAVGSLWTHEILPAGQQIRTLAPVIFHIAFMRTRQLYAAAVHIAPDIVHIEGFMLIGMELITTDRDGEGFARIPLFEEECIAKGAADRIPNRVRPGHRYGMSTRRNGAYYSFLSGEEVSSLDAIPEDMTGELIPPGTYAVFTVKGGPLPYKVIETYQYIYNTWLPESDYQWVNRPSYNYYENATGRSDSVIKIYVPVEKKGV